MRTTRTVNVLILGLVIAALFSTGSIRAQDERLSLQQCIDQALERNLNVLTKEKAVQRAKWDRREAWGDALPSVGWSANYNYSKTYGPQFIQLPDTAYIGFDPGSKRYSTGIGMDLTLFDGGYTWFRIKQSGQQLRGAQRDYQDAVTGASYDVKIAYYRLLQATMIRKVREDALARSKKQLEVTSSRYELGSASLSEKLKAQVNVANDSLRLLEQDNAIRAAEFSLNVILGRDVAQRVIPSDTLQNATFGPSLDECLSRSRDGNPSLLRSKADLDAAETGVWMARRGWLPTVTASMSWGWSPREGSDWFSYKNDDRSYSFGVAIRYSIFDGFQKFSAVSKAKLSAKTAAEVYYTDMNRLNSEVRQAYLDYQKSRMSLEVSDLATRSAEEDMKLQQERYRLGASSILELLDAQVSLTEAQLSRVNALFDLNKALADLTKAMGGK